MARGLEVVIGVRALDAGREAAARIGAQAVHLDLSDRATIAPAAEGVTVLVNNAGIVRDAQLVMEIHRVYEENLFVYGADKIWTKLNREGIRVARCTVERLMRDLGIQGCRRGRVWVRTTAGDDRDLVTIVELAEAAGYRTGK